MARHEPVRPDASIDPEDKTGIYHQPFACSCSTSIATNFCADHLLRSVAPLPNIVA